MMLSETEQLIDELFDTLEPDLARKIWLAFVDEREAGYQEGWTHRENWGAV